VLLKKKVSPIIEAYELTQKGHTYDMDCSFGLYSPVYRQTNEDVSKIFKTLDVENKNILTVASSGDFLLSFVNQGANSIETFDISIFTKYYQELKVAAIQALEYEEFLRFFYDNNCFSLVLYKRITPYLTKEGKIFWDTIFNSFKPEQIRNSRIFMPQLNLISSVLRRIPYLKDKEEYDKTRTQIKNRNFKFYNLNILKLPTTIKRKFDIIFISNIGDYNQKMGQDLETRINYLRNKTGKLLNANGVIVSTVFSYFRDSNGNIISEANGENWEYKQSNDNHGILKIYKRK